MTTDEMIERVTRAIEVKSGYAITQHHAQVLARAALEAVCLEAADEIERLRKLYEAESAEVMRLNNEDEDLRKQLAIAKHILERCRTVLGNMALENEGAVFNRWLINHEPLRNDARGLLPVIDAALTDEVNLPFERLPQHVGDPGFGPVPNTIPMPSKDPEHPSNQPDLSDDTDKDGGDANV